VTTDSPSLATVTSRCCKCLRGGAGDVQVRTDFVVAECRRGFGVNQRCGGGIQSKFGRRLVLNDAGDGGKRLRKRREEVADQDVV